MAKDRFSIYVQLIFRIFDSLTFRTAKKEYFRFSCDNQGKILPKEDGFFVVVGNERPETILIESGIYETIQIQTENFANQQVVNLWAEPKKGYPLVPDLQWIRLSVNPKEKIYAFDQEQEPELRLLEKADKGATSLKIYKDKKWQLDGATMLLCSKDKPEDMEMVQIQRMENDRCILSTPLEREYKKIKTGLFPLMSGTADEKGICEIAVRKQSNYIFLNKNGQIIESEGYVPKRRG